MKDSDKLLVIAETYFFIKGRFSAKELYEFMQQHNFRFHSGYTTKQIGKFLSKNKRFEKSEGTIPKYEVIS